jgi:hypothetical protein
MTTTETTWHVDRLSRQWVGPFVVMANGEPVTDWTYLIVRRGDRPADEAAINRVPTARAEGLGVLVGPDSPNDLDPNVYRVWIRYVSDLEAPVYGAFATIAIT